MSAAVESIVQNQDLETTAACEVLGVSRSAYYAWRSREPSVREARDIELTRLRVEECTQQRFAVRCALSVASQAPLNPVQTVRFHRGQLARARGCGRQSCRRRL